MRIIEEKVNLSGKYGTVKYVPRRDGLSGTTPLYAGYHLFLSDGKYYPYWAGEKSMGSSYPSIESAVAGIDKFITKQQENGKMLFIKPAGSAGVVKESSDGKKYIRSYSNKLGDQISIFVYEDEPDKEYGEGGPSGDYFRGRWTQNMQDYYKSRGFKLDESTSLIENKVNLDVKVPNLRDKHEKHIILTVNDPEGHIEELLRHIKGSSDPGHSFPVVVDPEDSEYRTEFYVDGDGSDRIIDITVDEFKED